jgi:prepilin-type processing-associated H-X9-DG protein
MIAKSVRGGFTQIELLMVFTIIAILASLLVPAIEQAREAARRVQCTNNLKQVAIALENYVHVHGVLPPGVVNESGPIGSVPEGYHFSWMAQLLPFMEQSGLSGALDRSTSVYDPVNARVRSAPISTYLCPSDRPSQPRTDGIAENNYVGCHNDVEAPIDFTNSGIFFLNSRIRYEDILDGSSETIFVGEKLRDGRDLGWASGTRSTLRNTGTPINTGLIRSAGWRRNPASVVAGPSPPDDPYHVGGFASGHTGGANFAFGDGSIRFVSQTINRDVYRCLGNRADGEMISAADY